MKFWDASALVPLLVEQATSAKTEKWTKEDPAILVWWAAGVECVSAVERLAREGKLSPEDRTKAYTRLEMLSEEWEEIEATPRVRENAIRFLKVHSLRAADAFQLAAAFVACEQSPPSLEFVCLDQRLGAAAGKEGFRILE